MAKENKDMILDAKQGTSADKKAEKKIISIDGKLKVETPESKNREAYLTLTESMKAQKILTGRIRGVEHIKTGGNDITIAVMYMNDYKIIIPVGELIDIPEIGDRNPKDYENYLVSKRLDSEIDFIVKDIKGEVAVASRKEAMDKKKKEYLLEKDKNGSYIVYEGAVVEARIVCTTRAGIFVEIFGVEVCIPSRELSYQRIQDATRDFKVGSRILVKILSIVRDENNETVVIEASVKQAGPNPYTKAMKRYQVDDKYVGTVSMVDENGVFVALDGGIDVLCKYPERGNRPLRGTNVTVRITTKNEEQNRLFGIITNASEIY